MKINQIIIESIKFKNFISHDKEVEVNFKAKYEESESKRFFTNTLTPKPRSQKSKEGILKTLGFIGKNASYKSSTLKAVYEILLFIGNFQEQKKTIEWNLATDWDFEKKYELNFDNPNKVINNFQKFKKEDLKHNFNGKKYDQFLEEALFKNFYETNCFNKNKPLNFEIIFWKNKKKNIFTLSFLRHLNKTKWIYSLNSKNIDLNESIFNGFKLNFLIANLKNSSETEYSWRGKIVFENVIQFLYIDIFKWSQKKLIKFLQIIDPAISSIKLRINKEKKYIRINEIIRSYDGWESSINWDQLSKGTQNFLFYVTKILQNDFLIIDEIEVSLHAKLVKLLIDIARNKNKQILFSTHSPLIIQENVRKYELYILDLNSNNSLSIQKGNKIFRERDNLIIKHLQDLVSNIPDIDIEELEINFFKLGIKSYEENYDYLVRGKL